MSGGDLFEAINTLGAVRRFRPDPVDDATVRQVILAATRAASARNAQPWYFLAIREPETKAEIARLYQRAWRHAQAHTQAVDADADIRHRPGYEGMMQQVNELARELHRVPVLLLACLDTRQLGPMADDAGRILAPQSAYASIFPAVQNLMLAAHGLGLGTTLTTVFQSEEAAIRVALGVPSRIHIAALLPLGYPLSPVRRTKRKPLSEVAFLDRWGDPLP